MKNYPACKEFKDHYVTQDVLDIDFTFNLRITWSQIFQSGKQFGSRSTKLFVSNQQETKDTSCMERVKDQFHIQKSCVMNGKHVQQYKFTFYKRQCSTLGQKKK